MQLLEVQLQQLQLMISKMKNNVLENKVFWEESEASKFSNENNQLIPKIESLKLQLSRASLLVDDIVLKKYLYNLHELEVIPIAEDLKEISDIRLFKINKMVYQNNENSTYKFSSVFSAVQNLNCGVFIIMDSDGSKTDFYMGIRSLDSIRTTKSLKDTLKNALIGQFPGVKTKDLFDSEAEKLLTSFPTKNVVSVSCIAKNKDMDIKDNDGYIQGLEKLAIAMQGQKYTAIILAKSTPANILEQTRQGYEQIYTSLSPFSNMQMSYGSNEALSISSALTHGTTMGTSYSQAETQQEGTSYSSSKTENYSTSKPNALGSFAKFAGNLAIGIGSIVAAPLTGGTSVIAAGSLFAADVALNTYQPKITTEGVGKTKTETKNKSYSKSDTFTNQQSKTQSNTKTEGETYGSSKNVQLTMQNKSLIDTLAKIDLQLKRIDECESIGMWECASYFLSDSQETAEMAAGTYKALMRGEESGVESSAINFWGKDKKNEVCLIRDYIKNFIHPIFKYKSDLAVVPVAATSLVSSNELAIQMGLPRKSVCGFPVIEHAEFAREIVKYNSSSDNEFTIGNVYSMGSKTNNRVKLDCNSLAKHTFVTGSTGSGKSNTIYEIINQLYNVYNIPFLVIEPAKGEYKNLFGNYPNVKVYGTNPKKNRLLEINPFRFPSEIHILEHLDRLIEIFNVCWPMYAAMPAILKDAVERAYIEAGWDLEQSVNKYDSKLFPSFDDVVEQIKEVLNESEYSDDNKGDYIGSLVTRLKSLTNGINGLIFTTNDIQDEDIFDCNAIVDLSRVGSIETKSLIMGILVLKLQEHRMNQRELKHSFNENLKHITVLEEAHNLLKKTNVVQSSEVSNMIGKSVEMLSNSIAEMRTYGEGFIIADQSPGLLDMSVIRNTNTKIILRLPDFSDRELVGRSAGLNDTQILELAKLEKGVAAISQNDWIEPILCKVNKFENLFNESTELYFSNNQEITNTDLILKKMIDQIMQYEILKKDNNSELNKLKNQVIRSKINIRIKCSFLEYISSNKKENIKILRKFVYDFFNASDAIEKAKKCNNINDWVQTVVNNLEPSIKSYSNNQINLVLALLVYEQAMRDKSYSNIFCRFTEVYREKGSVY